MEPITLVLLGGLLAAVIVVAAVVMLRPRRRSEERPSTQFISVREEQNVLVIEPAKDVLLCGMTDAKITVIGRELKEAVEASGEKNVVLDMGAVEQISSATLGTFIILNNFLKPRGRRLNLAAVQPSIAKILHITRLDEMLGVFASVDEAVAKLATPAPEAGEHSKA
jgi:anti-sigma B factor antagonist